MPLPVENLQPGVDPKTAQQVVIESIQQCIAEGKTEEECVALVGKIAQRRTSTGAGDSAAQKISSGLDRENRV